MPTPLEYTNNTGVCEDITYSNRFEVMYDLDLVVHDIVRESASGISALQPTYTIYLCDTLAEQDAYVAAKGLDITNWPSVTPPPLEES